MLLIDIAKSVVLVFIGIISLMVAVGVCREETDPKLKKACYQLLAPAAIHFM